MAGDWIKMRSDLFTHPKVVRMSSALKADTLRIVGGLMSVWCLFDAHSVDGTLEGYTVDAIDNLLRWDGFAQAMISVGWMINNGESLELPSFDTHNGASAKRRAQDADRKREGRKVPKTSAEEADKLRTREEKRREEKNKDLNPLGDQQADAKPKRKSRIPDDFSLTPERRQAAEAYWSTRSRGDLSAAEEFEKFTAHHRSHGAPMLDWDAAWQTWYCNAVKFNRPPVNLVRSPTGQSRSFAEIDYTQGVTADGKF